MAEGQARSPEIFGALVVSSALSTTCRVQIPPPRIHNAPMVYACCKQTSQVYESVWYQPDIFLLASRNRNVAALFLVSIVLFVVLGAATSYESLAQLPLYVRVAIFVFTPLAAIFVPLVRIPSRAITLGSVMVGLLQVVQPVLIVASGVPQQLQFGGLIHATLAIIAIVFSFRALKETR